MSELETLLADAAIHPHRVRRYLAESLERDGVAFLEECAAVFRALGEETPPLLPAFLAARGKAEELLESAELGADGAARLVRIAERADPMLGMRFRRRLLEPDGESLARLRWLGVLERALAPGQMAPLLVRLARDRDAVLRSRAKLLMGRITRNSHWLRQAYQDDDPRARANVIESLWGARLASCEDLVRAALRDPFPRVAANARMALYRAGADDALVEVVRMAEHHDAAHRASAAWMMGATGDPRFLDLLDRMGDAAHPRVRHNILRSRGRLRRHWEEALHAGSIDLLVRRASNSSFAEHSIILSAALPDARGASLVDHWLPVPLQRFEVIPIQGGCPVLRYTLEERKLRSTLTAALFFDEGWGASRRAGLDDFLTTAGAEDRWSVAGLTGTDHVFRGTLFGMELRGVPCAEPGPLEFLPGAAAAARLHAGHYYLWPWEAALRRTAAYLAAARGARTLILALAAPVSPSAAHAASVVLPALSAAGVRCLAVCRGPAEPFAATVAAAGGEALCLEVDQGPVTALWRIHAHLALSYRLSFPGVAHASEVLVRVMLPHGAGETPLQWEGTSPVLGA